MYKYVCINMASTVCTLLTGIISLENNPSWLALTVTWLLFNKRQRSPDFWKHVLVLLTVKLYILFCSVFLYQCQRLNKNRLFLIMVILILFSFNRCDCVGTSFIRYELVEFDNNGFILILLGSSRYYFIISSYHNI